MANNQTILNNLKVILGNDIEPNIVGYISSIKTEEDYEEFMENILNRNNSAHVKAYNAIKYMIFGKKLNQKQPKVQMPSNGSNLANCKQSQELKDASSSAGYQGKKGKKKFRDIREYQEERKEQQGRRPCDCMGQEHEFLNNCLDCGRIHCFKEGPGPCLFCGNEITVRGEIQGAFNAKPLMKPKLNKIFDDDKDYFKHNSKKSSRNDKKMVIALDFASRKVIESTQEDVKLREMLLEDSVRHLKKVEEIYQDIQKQNTKWANPAAKQKKMNNDLVELLVQMRHKKPAETEDLGEEDNKMPVIPSETRILDEELLSHVDQGLCLSMHQPYASLLVAGVKKHEGRVWPTTHRGRLWIAAAAKRPEEEEIVALEEFYRQYYKDPTLKFPKEYPTSCLLGCVIVEDCLDQEMYQKRFGNTGESSSPYVLICTDPVILPIFYPISGKHKIYALDKDLHKCAKIALQYAKYV